MSVDHPSGCHSSIDDEGLLLAIANRDQEAFATLYDRYDQFAFRIAYDVLRERHQAEDAVQEAFLRIWRAAGGFDPQRGTAKAWVRTVIQNGAVSRMRGKSGRARLDLPLDITYALASDDDPQVIAEAHERQYAVHQVLAALPQLQREAVELAYFTGLTCQEIAARTATSTGTVKSRLRLGLQKLREALAVPASVAV
jgi:RNA polymerase sigma-70 factor (ECF subfamily)